MHMRTTGSLPGAALGGFAVAVLLLGSLVGCGGGGGGSTLTTAELQDRIDAVPRSVVHMITEVTADGTTMVPSDITMSVDREADAHRAVIAANPEMQVPAQTQITIASDMYIHVGQAPGWTRLQLAEDLMDTADEPGALTPIDVLGFIDGDLIGNGTGTVDGATYDRYEGTFDWTEYLQATEGTGDYLRAVWERLPTDAELDLTFEVLIDGGGDVKQYTLALDVDDGVDAGRIVSTSTFADPASFEPIVAPAAGEIDDTVQVATIVELQDVISRLMQEA